MHRLIWQARLDGYRAAEAQFSRCSRSATRPCGRTGSGLIGAWLLRRAYESAEILADSFRFLGDLASELRTGFRAVARVATEALDLLLQPLDLSGSLLDGGRDRFVIGLIELEGTQKVRKLNIIRADP